MQDKILQIEDLTSGTGAPEEIRQFSHTPGTRVLFGLGCFDQLGRECATLGGKRALVVTDEGIVNAGHFDRARSVLAEEGIEVFVYDKVHENPTTEDVDGCVAAARKGEVDCIIGLGGGSSMDTGKGCNFLLTNGGTMSDYWGVGKATKPMLPFIAVPTTAGTGSECQSFALIADAANHQKMACGDKKSAAAVAILDPILTLTQPTSVTAHTGIDALVHAVETMVCRKANEISRAYSLLAFQLLDQGLEEVFARPEDVEARSRVQLGAAYAGTAIENSMLGAAHAAANPLTAHFGLVHGSAVGVLLAHVIRHNSVHSGSAREGYATLGYGTGERLAIRVTELLRKAGMKTCLSQHSVDPDSFPQLSTEAAGQWTAQFNPAEMDAGDFQRLYQSAL